VGVIFARTEQADKPDPVTEARLEEERAQRDGPAEGQRDEDRVFGI
jgi:hypothetical protein